MQLTPDTRAVSEMFVDVVDVLTDSVDEDSLFTLLSTCLEVTGLDEGSVSMLDAAGMVTQVASTNRSSSDEPDGLARRSITTLSTEYATSSSPDGTQTDWALPMRVRNRAIGVVRLHSPHGAILDGHTVATVQNLADTAAITIENAHAINQGRALVSQLQTALDSRVRIEQAKGVLAERHGTGFDDAFRHLRTTARAERRPIAAVANDVIDGLRSER